jgi:SAM-dependent methyltransferase
MAATGTAGAMTDSNLSEFREAWARKPVLRAIYTDFYRRMAARARPGRTLEIGGGAGNFKDFMPGVVASDILPAPWLDLVCDAQQLPFHDQSFNNIVMVDVLHHVEWPVRFLREAARVLAPGGRAILCEPAITPGSSLFYRKMHPEPVRMAADPLADGAIDPDRDPYDANQAIPTLLATRDRARLAAAVPGLTLAEARWFALWAYPASGGFRRWTLLPAALARLLLPLDWAAARLLGRLLGFRLLLVFERTGG